MLMAGVEKAGKMPAPPDGMMTSVGYKTLPNGWHYQVEYMHDTRLRERPYVVAYGFRPPCRMNARSADIYAEHLM